MDIGGRGRGGLQDEKSTILGVNVFSGGSLFCLQIIPFKSLFDRRRKRRRRPF